VSIVKEVIDALDLLTKSVENVQKLTSAIKSGVDYVNEAHPEARSDLIAMSKEIVNTLDALAFASSVVTRFGFSVEGKEVDSQPDRFNGYYQEKVVEEKALERQIEVLRGHCHIIRDHADSLSELASKKGLKNLFNFLGITSSEKEQELAGRLQQIYDEEMQLSLTVYAMSEAVKKAMEDVHNELGGATMSPSNVPKAASLLKEYQGHFKEFQSQCLAAGDNLKMMIRKLID
jgi:hypothetical protein